MTEIYLFDWGDTLMVDYPDEAGKMCDWETVKAVEGALKALQHISKNAEVYIATAAALSTEAEIKAAFARVGLDVYITGYFCKANLGEVKGTPAFLPAILKKLKKEANQITMVGDTFEKDIEPALKMGINAIWLCKDVPKNPVKGVTVISCLEELCSRSYD